MGAKAVPIQALGDRVVVEPIGGPDVTPGGILLPDVAKKKTNKGRVLSVGPGKLFEKPDPSRVGDWIRVPMSLKVGDVVYYSQYTGNEIEFPDGKKLIVFSEGDIIAIEKETSK